jgi:hypothetical protein
MDCRHTITTYSNLLVNSLLSAVAGPVGRSHGRRDFRTAGAPGGFAPGMHQMFPECSLSYAQCSLSDDLCSLNVP